MGTNSLPCAWRQSNAVWLVAFWTWVCARQDHASRYTLRPYENEWNYLLRCEKHLFSDCFFTISHASMAYDNLLEPIIWLITLQPRLHCVTRIIFIVHLSHICRNRKVFFKKRKEQNNLEHRFELLSGWVDIGAISPNFNSHDDP